MTARSASPVPLHRHDLLPVLLVPVVALAALPLVGSFSTWVTLTLAGLAMGMIIFIIASGLTLVFGLMDVLNFGHGAFISIGAYAAAVLVPALAGFLHADSLFYNLIALLALIALAMVVTGLLGYAFERIIIMPVYGQHLKQILVTVGGLIVAEQILVAIFGPVQIALTLPTAFRGSLVFGDVAIERYRLIAVVVGLLVFAVMLLVLNRTRIGLLIRAGVENSEMVEALGYHIRRLFVGVFMAGSALAGLGGVMWGFYRETLTPAMGMDVMVLVFIVVVIGGLGSVGGCFIGALLVAVVANYTGFLAPKLALVSNILPDGADPAVALARPLSGGQAMSLLGGVILSGNPPRGIALTLILLAILLGLALAPVLFPGMEALNVAAKICYFVVLAASYDLLLGYTGIVSFAHTMFFGIGGYGAGIALYNLGPSWTALVLGTGAALVAAVALALVIGLFSLRVRAIFFAMITLAVASAFSVLASQLSTFTGGEDGRTFRLPEVLRPAFHFTAGPFTMSGRVLAYYFVFAASVVLFLLLLRIVNSPFGRVLQAIRDNEFRAEALGYRIVVYRSIANCLAAAAAALAGVLSAVWLRYTGPAVTLSFDIMLDILVDGCDRRHGHALRRGDRRDDFRAGRNLFAERHGHDRPRHGGRSAIAAHLSPRPLASLARRPLRAQRLFLSARHCRAVVAEVTRGLRRLGLRIEGSEIFFPHIVHGAVHRAHGELRQIEKKIVLERRSLIKIKPERDLVVSERKRHAVVIRRDELVRLLGQNGERDAAVALVLGFFPDAGEHQRFRVLAREIIRLLAAFLAPLIKARGRDDAALRLEMRAELALAQAIGADVEQRRSRLAVREKPVDSEARNRRALAGDQRRYGLGRRHVGIEFEIQPRTAVEIAGDLRPFLKRAEAIAHERQGGRFAARNQVHPHPGELNWRGEALRPVRPFPIQRNPEQRQEQRNRGDR